MKSYKSLKAVTRDFGDRSPEYFAAKAVFDASPRGKAISIRRSPSSVTTLIDWVKARCQVADCGGDVLAKGLCQKHYGRARRKKPLGVDPLRGLTATVLIHCEPKLKRWLERTAKRDKVSVSARAAYLLREEMRSLTNGHPF